MGDGEGSWQEGKKRLVKLHKYMKVAVKKWDLTVTEVGTKLEAFIVAECDVTSNCLRKCLHHNAKSAAIVDSDDNELE